MNKKSPHVAAVLSFVIPGLGFIYLGKIVTGLACLFVIPFLSFCGYAQIYSPFMGYSFYRISKTELIAASFWWLLSVLAWIIGIYKSYKGAHILNDKYTKKCKYCAERIKIEALVCRYCGREIEA